MEFNAFTRVAAPKAKDKNKPDGNDSGEETEDDKPAAEEEEETEEAAFQGKGCECLLLSSPSSRVFSSVEKILEQKKQGGRTLYYSTRLALFMFAHACLDAQLNGSAIRKMQTL